MKCLLAIGCLLLVTNVIRADVDLKEGVQEYISSCVEEMNVQPEEMAKFEVHDLEGEDRTRMGCLKVCVMKKSEIYDGNTINEDRYRELSKKILGDDEDKIAHQMEVLKVCVDEVKDKTDECEIGYEFSKCLAMKSVA